MTDLYTKIPGDPGFGPDKLEILDELEIYLNQIEMVLFTRQGDVLGADRFGSNMEDLVYGLNVSKGQIETALIDQIQVYCDGYKQFRTDVNVRFFKGSVRDHAIIDVIINNRRATGLVLS